MALGDVMVFWSGVGKLVKMAFDEFTDAGKEAIALSKKWARESDDFLAEQYFKGRFTEKMAVTQVFKNRFPNDHEKAESVRRAVLRKYREEQN